MTPAPRLGRPTAVRAARLLCAVIFLYAVSFLCAVTSLTACVSGPRRLEPPQPPQRDWPKLSIPLGHRLRVVVSRPPTAPSALLELWQAGRRLASLASDWPVPAFDVPLTELNGQGDVELRVWSPGGGGAADLSVQAIGEQSARLVAQQGDATVLTLVVSVVAESASTSAGRLVVR